MSTSRSPHKALTVARQLFSLGLGAAMLTACSTPPQPPAVDETTRRPVNAKTVVELKTCQGDLSRATVLVSEMARAGALAAAVSRFPPVPSTLQLQPTAPTCADAAAPKSANTAHAETEHQANASGNRVAIAHFGLGSATWDVDPAAAALLIQQATDAKLIMIRGRTDATSESLQETALARRRAEAAADFLHQAGVPRDKLRLTWQGAGDGLAGIKPAERAQSRRVELEFYAAAPVLVSLPNRTMQGKATSAASL